MAKKKMRACWRHAFTASACAKNHAIRESEKAFMDNYRKNRGFERLMDCKEVQKFVGEEHGFIPDGSIEATAKPISNSAAVSCLRSGGRLVFDHMNKTRIVYLNGIVMGAVTYGVMESIINSRNIIESRIPGTNRICYTMERG